MMRNLFNLSLIFTIALLQIGCDTFYELIENISDQQNTEENNPPLSSHEKELLLGILENQKRLIAEMQSNIAYGDKGLIKESYEAILRLDQSYQKEFEKFEGELSYSDSVEISNKHHEIIRSIPSYSRLMK